MLNFLQAYALKIKIKFLIFKTNSQKAKLTLKYQDQNLTKDNFIHYLRIKRNSNCYGEDQIMDILATNLYKDAAIKEKQ